MKIHTPSTDIPTRGPAWTHPLDTWPELLVHDPLLQDIRQSLREELGVPQDAVWVATGHQPWPFHPGIVAKLLALDQAVQTFGWWGSFHLQTHSPAAEFAYPAFRSERVVWIRPFADRPITYHQMIENLPVDAMQRGAHELLDALGLSWRKTTVETNLSRFPEGEYPLDHRILTGFLAWYGDPAWTVFPTHSIFATRAFGAFLSWITRDPLALWERIQKALTDYRRRHRIRTRAQPFRDLERREAWVELPFWWIDEEGRDTLWIHAETRVLRARGRDVGTPNDPDVLGYVFPKALMLTFFYRYGATDFFIHGWGGLHYDEVTDQVAQDLGFRIRPRVAVTLSLGLADRDCEALRGELEKHREELKHIPHKPERYLPEDHPLKRAKKELVMAFQDPGADRSRLHPEMKALNQAMLDTPEVQARLRDLNEEIQRLSEELERCEAVTYREYPFYFFTREEVDHAFSGSGAR